MSSLALSKLPLFPLGSVLFPGGVLPLRIFEVRYLDMVRKCHQTGAPFGVVALTQGHEVRQPGIAEGFYDLGTLATIDELSKPQPGLLMIRCHGTQRFRINHREQLRHGLWVADVTPLDADQAVAVPDDLKATADALATLIQTLQAQGLAAADLPMRPPWQLGDCGWVANRWVELLPLALGDKQRLMSLDNPLLRLELATDLLAQYQIGLTDSP